MDLVSAAAIVGFFGDASLQVIVSNTDFNWGLRTRTGRVYVFGRWF